MGISIQDLNFTLGLTNNLSSFPGLAKYKNDLQQLFDNRELGERALGDASENCSNLEHISGVKQNLINPDYKDYGEVEEYLTDTLSLTKKLLADKELMEKEPFLKSYLGLYKTMIERSFSDSIDANDHYADDTLGSAIFFLDQFEKLPTGEQYANMSPEMKATADKITAFMDAYKDYYDFKGQIDKAIVEKPTSINEAKYKETQDMKLGKLQETVLRLSETPMAEMDTFFRNTGNSYGLKNQLNMLYDDKKHNLSTAAEQLTTRRLGVVKHMTPEENRLIASVGGQIKSIIGTAFGAGAKIDDLPGEAKDLTKELSDLGKECTKKVSEGFESEEAKNNFIKEVGEKTANYFKRIVEVDISNLTQEESFAMGNIVGDLRRNEANAAGALNLIQKAGKNVENVEQAKEPDFKTRFNQFYNMMKSTGDGYFMHKNSKEYTNMMNVAKVVSELSEKEPLNDIQRKTLGEQYGKLSKATQEYLTDRKIGSKSTEVGEDRFAGALGILNLVDPENGERVRAKAEAKRGKSVKFEDINKRAESKVKGKEKKAEAKKPEKKVQAKSGLKL